jgi:hypothetical protein
VFEGVNCIYSGEGKVGRRDILHGAINELPGSINRRGFLDHVSTVRIYPLDLGTMYGKKKHTVTEETVVQ